MRGSVAEQRRARYPDDEGYLERDGGRIYYESYGDGEQAILLFPGWEIVHSRSWKCQIPYLARHGRVLAFDRFGNGRADRPADVSCYDRRPGRAGRARGHGPRRRADCRRSVVVWVR